MAHPAQIHFIENVSSHLIEAFLHKKILEVGSLDINGSIRHLFPMSDYLGIDIAEGKSVDRVCRGEDFCAPAHSFDAIVSFNMFEHNREWQTTWLNMLRLLKTDGLITFGCKFFGARQHGTRRYEPESSPLTHSQGDDYYRNICAEDFMNLVSLDAFFSVWSFFYNYASHDLFFLGIGLDAPESLRQKTEALIIALHQYYEKINVYGEY